MVIMTVNVCIRDLTNHAMVSEPLIMKRWQSKKFSDTAPVSLQVRLPIEQASVWGIQYKKSQ